uniref:RNase H type-1 domain-containing protein n=1 Tax=Ananas comosus var. bracteatus TaxID=296719 RepID=A0A6V7PPM1_ANACO|nr:unnamed protein product [Ananas comosus var. bracteatus]
MVLSVRFLFLFRSRSPAISRQRRPAADQFSTASSAARLLLRSSGHPPPASASSARLLRSLPRRPPRRRRSSEPAAAGFRARRLLAPAPDGWVKLNTDGSFVGRGSSGGAGFVARDSEGLFVFAGASSCPGVNPLYSELWAIRAALTRAIEAGFPRVLLESDSSSAVDLLGGRIKNAPRGTKQLVQDCLALRCRFREIIIQHTYREGNRVADRLAALGRRSGQDRFYLHFDDLPDAVTRDRILFDLCGGASVRPRKLYN